MRQMSCREEAALEYDSGHHEVEHSSMILPLITNDGERTQRRKTGAAQNLKRLRHSGLLRSAFICRCMTVGQNTARTRIGPIATVIPFTGSISAKLSRSERRVRRMGLRFYARVTDPLMWTVHCLTREGMASIPPCCSVQIRISSSEDITCMICFSRRRSRQRDRLLEGKVGTSS